MFKNKKEQNNMNKEITFNEWLDKVIHLKDKVILPNGDRVSKVSYVNESGTFSHIEFQKNLFKEYLKQNNTK